MQDVVSLKRLVLVKRLYLEGIEKASRQYNYADQMLAVINLFLAVETMMGAIVLAVAQQPDEAIGTKGYIGGQPSSEQVSRFRLGDYHKFEQLYNQVVAILRNDGKLGENESLYGWSALQRLQEARNDAQHGAKAPHPSDLPELTTTAKEFIERVLDRDFFGWGTSLSEISMSDLIEDRVLREYLKCAEAALTEKRYRTCALLVRVTFLLGRRKRRHDWWRLLEGGSPIDDYDVSRAISEDWGVRPLSDRDTRLLSDLMHTVLRLPHMYDDWILGLDRVDRHKLAQVTPRLCYYPEEIRDLPPSDEVVVLHFLDHLVQGAEEWDGPYFQGIPSRDDCLWMCDYVTEVLLRWQREQRGRFAAVDLRYLEALPRLEQECGGE